MIPAILSPSLRRRTAHDGFALVIALSLMAFVLLLLLSITTLVQVETQGSQIQMQQVEAEQAALLGLQVALGELQLAAGPDQRITATADVLGTATDGNHQWVGVWDASMIDRYDTGNTAVRTAAFKKWLISAPPADDPTALTYVEGPVITSGSTANGQMMFQAVDASDVPIANKSVKAPLVPIDGLKGTPIGSYAYWVEDEGVKAKLSFTEDETRRSSLSAAELQRSRLSAVPGVDFNQLDELFGSHPDFTYPLYDSDNDIWRRDLAKLSSYKELMLLEDSGVDIEWLDAMRHEVTLHAYGLLTNVRDGGLRKDLSLAFEMDGAEDIPNDLTYFNQSDFVGTGTRGGSLPNGQPQDVTTAIHKPSRGPLPGTSIQNFFSRYAYGYELNAADKNSSSGESMIIRGPTWHNIRDYYSLYKRLTFSGGSYSLAVRTIYPDTKEFWPTGGGGWGAELDNFLGLHYKPLMGGNIATQQYSNEKRFAFRPTRGAYAPVALGYRMLLSLYGWEYDSVADTAKIGLSFDPWVYLWNPYDKEIIIDNYKLRVRRGFGLDTSITVRSPDPITGIVPPVGVPFDARLGPYIQANKGTTGGDQFMMFLSEGSGSNPMKLAPGEVRVFSAGAAAGATPLRLDGYPGANALGVDRGVLLKKHPLGLPINDNAIVVERASQSVVDVGFVMDAGFSATSAEHFDIRMYVVDSGDLNASKTSGNDDVHTDRSAMKLYINTVTGSAPGTSTEIDIVDIAVSDLFDPGSTKGRSPLGYFEQSTKSTKGDESIHTPVGVFSHFNPAGPMTGGFTWTRSMPSRYFTIQEASGSGNAGIPEQIGGLAYWGSSFKSASGQSYVPMREIPSGPLLSIVSLRHGDFAPFQFEPMNAFGNSYSHPMLEPDKFFDIPLDVVNAYLYDTSWLFNDGVWDGYYFSGITPDFSYGGTYVEDGTLEESLKKFFNASPSSRHGNPRYLPYLGGAPVDALVADLIGPTSHGYRRLAAHLMVDGGFNVNSTSVSAWAALLGANRAVVLSGGASPNPLLTPFPKSLTPLADDNDAWKGYPGLTKDEIIELAQGIVDQVKLRGPFMSLADFVNRRLDTGVAGESGAIQSAIDNSTSVNDTVSASEGIDTIYSDTSQFVNDLSGTGTADSINGHLTQADILQPIAPVLSVRSDTFRISSYGEKKDPITGAVVSRARCEVVVQRMPEYLDPADAPEVAVAALSSAINQQYGRRFVIVSFKWLNEEDV
jgi:hypothetical protein